MGGMLCCVESSNYRKGQDEQVLNDFEEGYKEKRQPRLINSCYINPYNSAIFGDTLLDLESEDEEIDHQFKNKYEQLIPMNKHSLIDFYEKIKSTDPNEGKWSTKLNEENVKVSIKMKGSELNLDLPLIWAEIYFEPGTEVQKLMKAIHNGKERMKWDKDIQQAEILQLPSQNMLLWHQMNKSAVKVVNQRDFVEKKLKFKDGDKQYIFFSSIPDEFKKVEEGITRAYTLIGFHCFETLEDGRIKFTGIMQNDLSLTGTMGKIGGAAVLNQVPKTMKTWYSLLADHVKAMPDDPDTQDTKDQQADTQ